MVTAYTCIADRLYIPSNIRAILWDLDGTLVDSLLFDLQACSGIMTSLVGRRVDIPEDMLKAGFALSGIDFWEYLFREMNLDFDDGIIEKAYREWVHRRSVEPFPINKGIRNILESISDFDYKMAVVSNNNEDEVQEIVSNTGLLSYFSLVVGNNGPGRAKKPSPDSYLYAASKLEVDIADCMVVEDSVLGLQAGRNAKAFVVAVASGAESYTNLIASELANDCYVDFSPCSIRFRSTIENYEHIDRSFI